MSKLTTKIFGLDFELLYQKGYWPEQFGTYAIADNDEIVSNVCFHQLELEKDNVRYKALQIGTVSTYEKYRKRGLSRQLMEAVIKDYESDVDVMYLFANETVIDFYPKFGFAPVKHILFKQGDLSGFETCEDLSKKLSLETDHELLHKCIRDRVKNSKSDYIYGDDYLKMFYCMYVFSDCIYYHEREGAILVCKKEDDRLVIHDIFVKSKGDMKNVISCHLNGVKNISYGFEIDLENLIPHEKRDSNLFIRTKEMSLLKEWYYPTLSIA